MLITPLAEHTDKDRNCYQDACYQRGGVSDYSVIDRPKRLRDQAKYSHILGLDAIEADDCEHTSRSGQKRNEREVSELDKFKYRREKGERDKDVEPEAVTCPLFAPSVVKYSLARHSYRIEQSARVCTAKQVIQRPNQVGCELEDNDLGAALGGVYPLFGDMLQVSGFACVPFPSRGLPVFPGCRILNFTRNPTKYRGYLLNNLF